MNKVVLQNSYGTAVLSEEALTWLKEHGLTLPLEEVKRHHPLLVRMVEELGTRACRCGRLRIQEIPDDRYYIEDHDGLEYILTPSNIAWTVIEGTLIKEQNE